MAELTDNPFGEIPYERSCSRMNLAVPQLEQQLRVRKNGEAYELVTELLGDCSACNLHLAMSLVAKMRMVGLKPNVDALVMEPAPQLQRRQRRRQEAQLAFRSWPAKVNWLWPSANNSSPDGTSEGTGDLGNWAALPRDVLLHVVAHLSDADKQVAACTCAAWKSAIGPDVCKLNLCWAGKRHLNRQSEPLIDNVVRGAATIFSALRCVDLRRCELLGSEALAFIAAHAFSQLQVLDLSGCTSLTDIGVIAVAESCPQLVYLSLASCQDLTDCAFVALGSCCKKLETLNACGCEGLTDLGLRCLSKGARSLKDLNLGWCEAITDFGIMALAEHCRQLASLDLCGCLQVGDTGITALATRCSGLKSLGLHCCRRLTDASPAAVAAHLRQLTRLNISGCRALSPSAVQEILDVNPGLHTCSPQKRNVIVAGCLNLLCVNCTCKPSCYPWG